MRFFNRIDRDEIAGLLERDEYFWLDLTDPSGEQISELGKIFRFHPLALEDARNQGQRPKLEDFGDHMFLVYYGAEETEGGAIEMVEVHAFLSGSYIVTTHGRACAVLEQIRDRLDRQPPRSEQFVIYRVLDGLTDTFFPVLERLDDRIEHLDEEIFERADQAQLRDITALRRTLVELRRVVTPQRDLLAQRTDDILEIPGLEVDSRNYFRDIYDHLIRLSDQIDSYRDLLSGSRDAYLSVVSNRLNQITKQLTVMASIFLPLSFIVGFFGQNFKWMVANVQSSAAFFGLGLGSLALSVIALVVWFRRSDYI